MCLGETGGNKGERKKREIPPKKVRICYDFICLGEIRERKRKFTFYIYVYISPFCRP